MPLLYFPSSRDREHGDVVLKPDWFSLQLLSMFSPVNYYHFSLLTASGNLRYISYFFFETFWVLTFMKFSLGRCSLSAPSYQMIILETDLKWLPLLTDFPESFNYSHRYSVMRSLEVCFLPITKFSPNYHFIFYRLMNILWIWIEHEPLILIMF